VKRKTPKKTYNGRVSDTVTANYGRVIGLEKNRKAERLKPSVLRELAKMSADIKAGRNLSPMFDNAKDAIAYLKSKIK